ncbi:MAG: RNA 2',3'-cyclic phosphodiesterase [Litoreibacter sp.]|nr:RNA 2',3'-cyclic phosphodiesterase [Litoreibacter sp.]
MRVFVAIDVPETIRREIETLQNAIGAGRRVPAENLHLTLRFLGEQPEETVEEAHHALSTIRAAAFDLQLAGVGSFGSRSPQLIYADIARCPDLTELVRRITRRLRQAGVEFRKQRFRPHVTIARLPKILSGFELEKVREFLAEHAAFRGTPFRVRSFELYQSTLSPRGALHDPLASYGLDDA